MPLCKYHILPSREYLVFVAAYDVEEEKNENTTMTHFILYIYWIILCTCYDFWLMSYRNDILNEHSNKNNKASSHEKYYYHRRIHRYNIFITAHNNIVQNRQYGYYYVLCFASIFDKKKRYTIAVVLIYSKMILFSTVRYYNIIVHYDNIKQY